MMFESLDDLRKVLTDSEIVRLARTQYRIEQRMREVNRIRKENPNLTLKEAWELLRKRDRS